MDVWFLSCCPSFAALSLLSLELEQPAFLQEGEKRGHSPLVALGMPVPSHTEKGLCVSHPTPTQPALEAKEVWKSAYKSGSLIPCPKLLSNN